MAAKPMRVFITGASSGIGAALAKYYAAQGAQLGLVARRLEALEALCGTLDCESLALAGDVGNPDVMRALAERYSARFGLPDVVIANAGVSVGTLTEYAEDFSAFEAVVRTNVLGMVATFQPFIHPMRERGAGRLVGIASIAGTRGLPGAGAYSASKAAARTYLESLRVELRGSGVDVITISPGYIATPMTAVNPYRMPFILPADEAARRFARAIAARRAYVTIPWQMACVAKILACLPIPLYDRLFAKAGRKPRGLPI